MGGCNALQNGLCVGDDILALLQGLFLAWLQRCGVNGVYLRGQRFNPALLVGLAGIQRVQLPFDGN